jgi:hypothetical protein
MIILQKIISVGSAPTEKQMGTSDRHLLDIDKAALASALGDMDLPGVQIFHPKALLKAIKKRAEIG